MAVGVRVAVEFEGEGEGGREEVEVSREQCLAAGQRGHKRWAV
jgi:hypothetical protein